MSPLLASSIVDWSALGKAAGVAAAGGLALSLLYCGAVLAIDRASELRRRPRGIALYGAGGVALVACVALVVAGVLAMLSNK
jgi:hypothetical protein